MLKTLLTTIIILNILTFSAHIYTHAEDAIQEEELSEDENKKQKKQERLEKLKRKRQTRLEAVKKKKLKLAQKALAKEKAREEELRQLEVLAKKEVLRHSKGYKKKVAELREKVKNSTGEEKKIAKQELKKLIQISRSFQTRIGIGYAAILPYDENNEINQYLYGEFILLDELGFGVSYDSGGDNHYVKYQYSQLPFLNPFIIFGTFRGGVGIETKNLVLLEYFIMGLSVSALYGPDVREMHLGEKTIQLSLNVYIGCY